MDIASEQGYKHILIEDFFRYLLTVMVADWLRKSPNPHNNLEVIINAWKERVAAIQKEQAEELGEDPDVANILAEAVLDFSRDDVVEEMTNSFRKIITIMIKQLDLGDKN